MNYIEANLKKDEKVVSRIKHSWAGIIGIIIGAAIVCAVGVLLIKLPSIVINIMSSHGVDNIEEAPKIFYVFMDVFGVLIIFCSLLILIPGIVEIKCAQLVVTNKRILGRRGFISKVTADIMLNKIDTINAGNGFLGEIFHYGYIEIVSAASVASSVQQRRAMRYKYISNTLEFRQAVLDAIDTAKEEERKAQAEEQAKAMRNTLLNR